MPAVKGPNGQVVNVPDSVASGLVGAGDRGYSLVKDEPKAEKPEPTKKSTTRKSSSEK